MRLKRLIPVFFSSILLFRCAGPVAVIPAPAGRPPYQVIKPPVSPNIRVGLLKGMTGIEFSAGSRFEMVFGEDGFRYPGTEGQRWRVELIQSVPGKSAFRLLLAVSKDRFAARSQAEHYERAGYAVDIVPTGNGLQNMPGLSNSREYRICIRQWFETWDDARKYQKNVWPDSDTRIVRDVIAAGQGCLRLTNTVTGEVRESSKPVTIRGADITLHDVPVGVGFHWECRETRIYPEKMEFTFDIEGKLAVVNVVPLEDYLKGVVPSEMAEGFPIEALKAQAVAARGKALGNRGIVHVSDPYDVCADVHCQVYSGLSKRSPKTDAAVDQTAGIFMMQDDKICDAIFGAVCGGHTEDVDKAWGGEKVDYLQGRIDGSPWLRHYGSLQDEESLRRWIDDSPDAFCNTQKGEVPAGLRYTVKYFRWEIRLTQTEIQKALATRTGQSLGEIRDLIPAARGVSGRITALEVIGTRGSTVIRGELNIRKSLCETTLWSACFYVEKSGYGPVPEQFILRGAGFGHGVGMCQTGAAMMALKGRMFHHILRHYYKGVKLKKFY